MAHQLTYRVLRAVAIGLGAGLTAYSAWLSWSHFGDPTGPIAAVTGAGLFVFGEYAWHDRQRLRAVFLFGLGALALVISGTAVLQRVAATQEARLQGTRSDNLPRIEADKALTAAQEGLAAAVAAAQVECTSGRGRRCTALEEREDAARKRVEDAREAGWSWCTQRRGSGSAAHRGLSPDQCGAVPAGRAGPPAPVVGANGAAPALDRAGAPPQGEGEAQEEQEEAGASQARQQRQGCSLQARIVISRTPASPPGFFFLLMWPARTFPRWPARPQGVEVVGRAAQGLALHSPSDRRRRAARYHALSGPRVRTSCRARNPASPARPSTTS